MKHKLSIVTAVCAASMASSVFAGSDFSSWDADGDKAISLAEWDETIETENVFDKVDENNNGIFDIDEAVESVFTYDMEMDVDAGGHIERQEFTLGTFNRLDSNDDDQLDESEMGEFLDKGVDAELFS